MTRLFVIVAATAALASAGPAMAQTPASMPSAPGPTVNLWDVGGAAGTAVVERFGGTFGAEAGVRAWKNLDVLAETGWMQNLVSRQQIDKAGTLAAFLQQTQGKTATSSVKVPTIYLNAGARWVFEQWSVHPYVLGLVGVVSMKQQPSFTLDGANITSQLPQFGVTLGQDLNGTIRRTTFGGGFGVLMPLGRFYLDVGVRVNTVKLPSQRVNANRLQVGFGARF